MPTNLITLENTFFDGFSLKWDAVAGADKYHIQLVGNGPWAANTYEQESSVPSLRVRLLDWETAFSIQVSYEDNNHGIFPIGSPSLCRTRLDHSIVVVTDDNIEYFKQWLNLSASTVYPSVSFSAEGCASITLPTFDEGVRQYALVLPHEDGLNVIPYPKTDDAFLLVQADYLAGTSVECQVIPFLT